MMTPDAPKIRKKYEKLRKNAKNDPNMAPKGSKRERSQKYGGLRVGLSGLLNFHSSPFEVLSNHAGGGPPRIVYALRILPRRRRTWNVCVPVEHGSYFRETSAKRVLDNLQVSIF